MLPTLNRLGPKLILTTLIFLLVLATATALLMIRGFRQTQSDATLESNQALERQGREALRKLTDREAQISTAQLQQAVAAVQTSKQYFLDMAHIGGTVPWNSAKNLQGVPTGGFYDPRLTRLTDIWIPDSFTSLDEQSERDLRESAVLDTLFPTLLRQNPDAVAIYFINPLGVSRYHPVIGLHMFSPFDYEVTQQVFYRLAAPASNPTRGTVWTPPYEDPADQGLLVSASTPVYEGDHFRGVITIDISLERMIARLNEVKPVEDGDGYAFLVDETGHLVAAPENGIKDLMGKPIDATISLTDTRRLDLLTETDPAFRGVLEAMQRGESGVQQIRQNINTEDEHSDFVAYAPLPNIGWSLGIVAPVTELIAESANVKRAIGSGTDETVQSTLLSMALFFSLALIGTIFISRRLTRPITALVAGTRSVAAGNLDVTIPVTSRDELGLLAESFNQMTSQLAANRQRLETWNLTLERTVQERTADLAQAMQAAQEARAAAEQANELKTQFLANMSHELRTPLNSIINFTRILMAGMRGPVTEGQIDYLNRVRHSGEHLLGLINDILDLSKIEAGKMELFKEPLSIADLVHSVMSSAQGLTKGKPIELRHEVMPNLPTIEADRTRLRQILLNLLSNAAKFTDTGSIAVQVTQRDTEVLISVTDTGIGIQPEHQELIFEEFRQVDGASNRLYEGTGLGLAICRRLIQLHGGQIWVESTPGQGSTFSFTLPLQIQSVEKSMSASVIMNDFKGAPILVIDDDPGAIEIVATYLGRDGHAVTGVSDSRIAIEEARRLKPAAIILDVLMPHKDGWEVLSALKADPELKLVPVVLYSIMEEQKLGFYLGASAYLTKPIDEEQLRKTVAQLVASGSMILVIDDDPDAIEIVSQQIKQLNNYTIITAANGKEALEQIAATRPDLIVLDLMMPEVDGFAVLEQLEKNEETRSIPVIVLTAKDLTNQERSFLNQRVNGLLNKGATSAGDLLEKVSGLLESVADYSTNTPT
jgi:signal transduction histidine kinase/DNA-binding response OmpR family regulator